MNKCHLSTYVHINNWFNTKMGWARKQMYSILLFCDIVVANGKGVVKLKIKHKKISASALVVSLCIMYIFIALFPYMGSVNVSAETSEAFSMDNFFWHYKGPERVMLLEDPQYSFFHRINLIFHAQTQIILSSFAIDGGESGNILVGALLHAADRGVNVSIINNAVIGQMPLRYRDVLTAHENINVYLFNRFNFFRPRYINSALHDKYMIVDNTFMILGGRNISDKYFASDEFAGRLSLDREVLVYNTDAQFHGSIADVVDYFNRKITSNQASRNSRIRRTGDLETQKAHFISLYLEYRRSVGLYNFDYYSNTIGVNRITLITNPIGTAKNDSVVAYNLMRIAQNSSVVIAQSPYVAFTRRNLAVFNEIVSGRDFTLSTNSLASTPNLPSFSNYYVNRRRILDTGIAIYEFQSTQAQLHAKTYLFDGRLTAIGSFNLNERSVRSDTESMLIIDSVAFHNITLEAINSQISQSLRVNAENSYDLNSDVEVAQVSFGKRALYRVTGHLLRPLRFMF